MSQCIINPWQGLESYHENQILYGRDIEIKELSQCVLNYKETVLYGKSGIGKSSLINAGIIPAVRAKNYVPIVIRLDHNNTHQYINQIAEQIERYVDVSDSLSHKLIDDSLLWEYFHTRRFKEKGDSNTCLKIVIFFDQFEEIFTLQASQEKRLKFFKELADVINGVMPRSLMEVPALNDPKHDSIIDKNEEVSGFSGMNELFSSIAAQVESESSKYIEDNEIHFVFSLREDFLSEFEFYTTKIPSLKNHRYGLRSINEEQAAEIIMKPCPGLVEEDVAKLIIQSVTGRKDFSLGDEPEIEVDAAVLSLFLKQIFEKRTSAEDVISADLVNTFGKDIIVDFYEKCIEDLSSEQIDFIEQELLTGENRRDSLSRSDFMAGGFSESQVRSLVDVKKLLRQFYYGNDIRIELIHDILCPVVKEHKEAKAEKLRIELERKSYDAKIKRQKSRFRFLLLFFLAVLVIGSIVGIKQIKRIQGSLPDYQVSVNVIIKESDSINDEYWRVKLIALCGQDTLLNDIFDRSTSNTSFEIKNSQRDSELTYHIIPLLGNIRKSKESIFMADSTNLTIEIKPKKGDDVLYDVLYGRVFAGSGSRQPVMGAIVIWGDMVTKSDLSGNFSFNGPSNYIYDKDPYNTIKIVKDGYRFKEQSIKKNGSIYAIDLEDEDRFISYCREIEKLDSVCEKKLVFEGLYSYNYSNKKYPLVVNTFFLNDSTIQGYYYYKTTYQKRKKNKESAYMLFNGHIKDGNKIVINTIDDAFNKRTVLANVSDVRDHIKGEAFSSEKLYDFELTSCQIIEELDNRNKDNS